MSCIIGLDIGGTKIAGASFDQTGREQSQISFATPSTYESFLDICRKVVGELETLSGPAASIGACAPSVDGTVVANIPCLTGKPLRRDLESIFKRQIPFSNDANCAALAEASEGSGRGYSSVFGLIMGTGIGGGFILNGKIITGANGLCGEIGHLPLPYYEASDGERVVCGCGQSGCIEKLIAGPALGRLYQSMTGQSFDARQIAELAFQKDQTALNVLDHFYTTVAKALVAIIHSFDPDIITVSGGLNTLPGMYDEIPKRWGRFALNKNPVTKFVPAAFGSVAGLRGAALLGRAG